MARRPPKRNLQFIASSMEEETRNGTTSRQHAGARLLSQSRTDYLQTVTYITQYVSLYLIFQMRCLRFWPRH
jgi:hypothetical protein